MDQNPAIISISEFNLGILFEINPAQQESVRILKNFIRHQISNLIFSRDQPQVTPISAPAESMQRSKVKISIDSKVDIPFPKIANKLYETARTWKKSERRQVSRRNLPLSESQQQDISEPENVGLKRQEIRLLLHPSINQDNQIHKQMWVPGMHQIKEPREKKENRRAFQKYF